MHKKGELGNKYFLFVHPYTFVSYKPDEMLLYNTLSGYYILEKNEKIIKKLTGLDNSYVIMIYEKDLKGSLKDFLKKVKDNFMADYYRANLSKKKPIQLYPSPKVEIEYESNVPEGKYQSILQDDAISEYLSTITIQINNECDNDCSMCGDAFKQFLCCHGDPRFSEINYNLLVEFFNEAQNDFSIQKVNLTGGNIFKYSNIKNLIGELNKYSLSINYFVNYENFIASDKPNILETIVNKANLIDLLVPFPLKMESFKKCIQRTIKIKDNLNFIFVVECDDDFYELERVIEKYDLEKFKVIPYYNKNNIDFFKKHVFIKKNFLDNNVIKLHDIKKKMIINPHKIKQISINSQGDVYSDFNYRILGRIGQDDLIDMVRKAFSSKDSSWRKTRKDFKKCGDCPMQFLCPPISNYELVMDSSPMCWKGIKN